MISSDEIVKSVEGASEYRSTRTCRAVAMNARSCGNHGAAMSCAGIPADEAFESDRTCGCCHVPRYSRSPSRVIEVVVRTRYLSPGTASNIFTMPGQPVPEILRPSAVSITDG